ncbi:unnamed protein product [Rhizopus stolonifer]
MWVISTKKVVEDVFKDVISTSTFERLAHSFILDLTDPLWRNHFTEEETEEMKSDNPKPFKPIPELLQKYMDSYDDLKTVEDVRKYAFAHYLNINQFDKRWVQQCAISAADLFVYEDTLDFTDYSETELLYKVWSFVYTLFGDKYISARLGEKSSISVFLAKNDDRYIESEERS